MVTSRRQRVKKKKKKKKSSSDKNRSVATSKTVAIAREKC